MGCSGSSIKNGSKEQSKRNAQIEKDMKKTVAKSDMEIKLLLLGTGESGKSTIAKQIKILHQNGYTTEELLAFKSIIYENILSFFELTVNRALTLELQFEEPTQKAIDSLKNKIDAVAEGSATVYDGNYWESLKIIWDDPQIKKLYDDDTEIANLNQTTKDYLGSIERISAADYVPTKIDILMSRAKTTGIIESTFYLKSYTFKMIDVGGQRSERRKWIHCFEKVTALIFVTSLSEYNQTLLEDANTNRMNESLKLFNSTSNSHWFSKATIILFLNKKDLFEEKITKIPLTMCFPEYDGLNQFEEASEYIKMKFVSCCRDEKREIFTYFTCATSTEGINAVFEIITDTIIKNSLREYGLY